MSKYNGIDSRIIKCSDQSESTIEAGISFDHDNGQNILVFHFLDYYVSRGIDGKKILTQKSKSMHLNKENTKALIKELKQILQNIENNGEKI